MKGASFLVGVVTLCFCVTAQAQNLLISEIVDGTLPGGQPKWVELTNCGDMALDMSGFSIGNYNNGGTELGGGASTVLAGMLDPGASYVVAYENEPEPMATSVFEDVYGFAPDFYIGPFINGDDAIALFLADGTGENGEATGDGSDATMIDVYGVIGVDGTGQVWECTDGYSYRWGGASATTTFDPAQWFFGGPNSLEDPGGDDMVELELILANTTPGTHICAAAVINEILADPASDLAGDANGDGVRDSSDDEFVEIYNNTGSDLDVTGWTISDEFGLRHTFPEGSIVSGNCAVVVFGGGTPTGSFGGALVQTASSGALGLNNGGDTVTLADGGGTIAAVTYGSEGGMDQSLTRDPDVTGGFVLHSEAEGSGGALFSPGTMLTGEPFGGCFVPATGACCDESTGECTEGQTQEDCEASGGTYGGDDSTCDDIVCEPPPTGACCLAGFCGSDYGQAECEQAGGMYQGDDSMCGDVTCPAGPEVAINELRIDQPGGDDDEYFELAAAGGSSLDGLTYIVIGDGSGGSGTIENVTPLTGSSVPGSGYFVAAESTFTLGVPDLVTELNFENSDNVTHLLVAGFSGMDGDDLDTDDDGILDVTPWLNISDCVALIETPGEGDHVYCDQTVGPDGTFVPGQAYRCVPSGEWTIGGFALEDGTDTPGAQNLTCVIELTLDARPGGCPNPLNRGSKGVLPVALAGMMDVDLTQVDISTISLSRADGVGGSVSPNEGPPGPHTEFEDVASPFEGEEDCECSEAEGDGITDLSMKFKTQELVEAFELNDLEYGALIEVVLTANLNDGTIVTGSDCLMIVPLMAVEANAGGVYMEVTPPDILDQDSGFAPFERSYNEMTEISVTAPAIAPGSPQSIRGSTFYRWLINGVPQPVGQQSLNVVIDGTTVLEAVYRHSGRATLPDKPNQDAF